MCFILSNIQKPAPKDRTTAASKPSQIARKTHFPQTKIRKPHRQINPRKPKIMIKKILTKTLGLRSASNLNFQSLKYGNDAVVECPSSVEQSEDWGDEWLTVARGDESMPGNLWDSSGDHREMGSSTPPPRHCRRKAKMARERGRTVRRRRSFAVKEWLAAEDGGWGRREVCRPAIGSKRMAQGWWGGSFVVQCDRRTTTN